MESSGARKVSVYEPSLMQVGQRRPFHDYFVTHLPSSSLHPDSQSHRGPHHKLPRSASSPHTSRSGASPAAPPPMVGLSRETTVVRIPLQSAKHHFGASMSRGTRPYNEDAYQAGVIEIPAFSKRSPTSLTRSPKGQLGAEATSADSASGDPQVFYFGVFDGHGGAECSGFLRQTLHKYIEDSTTLFELRSSLRKEDRYYDAVPPESQVPQTAGEEMSTSEKNNAENSPARQSRMNVPQYKDDKKPTPAKADQTPPPDGSPPEQQMANQTKALELEQSLVQQWNETVGGYFKRFQPPHFTLSARSRNRSPSGKDDHQKQPTDIKETGDEGVSVESVMTYAFLKADLDFILAQAERADEDPVQADKALNDGDILGETSKIRGKEGGQKRFKGGSTCSVAMISTPTPTPFWHPATPSTLLTSHVGDTRILLCSTANGSAIPLTTNHHPSSPSEGSRLRRYAATFVTDSFGEERMSGLANTRAFGDMQSKRIGVSAEPEIRRLDIRPAEYSFIVLVSDGISGTLNDQEIVDVVKEARTPDQGAKDVVRFATEVSTEGDNATCMVVRLGGWERRIEGGLGAMGTREVRDWRRKEAADPRTRRT
ncbi:MAG: hypothetical protein M1837_004435 [Sclerophora amabilis]|nr:MAG: hypothetical protein M1837_004435 [Sclerophora amabilis]